MKVILLLLSVEFIPHHRLGHCYDGCAQFKIFNNYNNDIMYIQNIIS